MCGTAFYASLESLAHPLAKRRLVEASGDATQRSALFDLARGIDWPAQWNLRTRDNDFSRRWTDDLSGLTAQLAGEQVRYQAARDADDFNTAAVIAGEAADLVHAVEPAGVIVERIVREAGPMLRAALALLPRD